MNEANYVVECTPGGEFYAYLLDYHQCCACLLYTSDAADD